MGWFGKRRSETPPPVMPAPDIDPAVVACALIDELRAQGITGAPRVEGNYLFVDEAGVTRHVFLGNLVHEYAKAPLAARAALLATYARLAARPVGLAKPDLRTRVLPKLTPRREREVGRGEVGSTQIPGRPLAGGALTLELAVDEPEAVRVLTDHDVATASLQDVDVEALAIENLGRRSAGRWTELVPGLFQSPWGDHFDGARLALPSLVRALPIKGMPVAVVPNRCALLVTGIAEPAGLAVLCKATRMLMAKDRPVHVAPLVLERNAWRALDAAADLAAVARAPSLLYLQSMQVALDLAMCSEQVGATLRARGFTHVGEFGVLRRDDLEVTVAECPAGARVAIPRVDLVRFDDSLVSWHKLEAVLGADLVPLDVWPPHHELRRRPTPDEIAAIRVGA